MSGNCCIPAEGKEMIWGKGGIPVQKPIRQNAEEVPKGVFVPNFGGERTLKGFI